MYRKRDVVSGSQLIAGPEPHPTVAHDLMCAEVTKVTIDESPAQKLGVATHPGPKDKSLFRAHPQGRYQPRHNIARPQKIHHLGESGAIETLFNGRSIGTKLNGNVRYGGTARKGHPTVGGRYMSCRQRSVGRDHPAYQLGTEGKVEHPPARENDEGEDQDQENRAAYLHVTTQRSHHR